MPTTSFNRSATQVQRSHGIRRRHKGKMVLPNGEPRSQHIDKMRSSVTYECDQPAATPTKFIPGYCKVQMPRNRTRYTRGQ